MLLQKVKMREERNFQTNRGPYKRASLTWSKSENFGIQKILPKYKCLPKRLKFGLYTDFAPLGSYLASSVENFYYSERNPSLSNTQNPNFEFDD